MPQARNSIARRTTSVFQALCTERPKIIYISQDRYNIHSSCSCRLQPATGLIKVGLQKDNVKEPPGGLLRRYVVLRIKPAERFCLPSCHYLKVP